MSAKRSLIQTAGAAAAKVLPITAGKPSAQHIVPLRIGAFGPEKSGKTTTIALLLLAMSVKFHNRAPVVVTDTEPGWHFLKPIFDLEKVPLIIRTTPTFKSMVRDLSFAQEEGACGWAIDQLGVPWMELQESFKSANAGFIPINRWGDIRQLWREYTVGFRNANLNTAALGRLKNVSEEIEINNTGETKLMKTGTEMKAGGSESFGYEPDLLLEFSLERKAKRKQGVLHEGEGRMVHRVDVIGDRTWALNGMVGRFSDKSGYQVGGYNKVWEFFEPHFKRMQLVGEQAKIVEGETSRELITESGSSAYHENRSRRDIMVAEVSATLDMLWTGTKQEMKTMRTRAIERVFGFKTKEAMERVNLQTIERGLRIFQSFEQYCKATPDILLQEDDDVIKSLDKDIEAYDRGDDPGADLAF